MDSLRNNADGAREIETLAVVDIQISSLARHALFRQHKLCAARKNRLEKKVPAAVTRMYTLKYDNDYGTNDRRTD